MSSILQPMLPFDPKNGGTLPADTDAWVMEPKFDGWRFVVHITKTAVVARTRRGNTYRLWGIEDDLPSLFPPDTILDCEVIVQGVGKQATDVATVLAHPNMGTLNAVVFDVMRLAGIDARALPWEQRRWIIEKAIPAHTDHVYLAPVHSINEGLLDVWLNVIKMEGAIVKRRSSPYRSGVRTRDWLKVKPSMTIDLRIVGFEAGVGKFAGTVGAVKAARPMPDGTIQVISASGMTDTIRDDMRDNPEKYIGQMAEFAYWGPTSLGYLRHPQFRRLREDL